MKKIIKNSVVRIILGIICLLATVIFAPIWNWWEKCPWRDWGNQILYILIAGVIILYLALFLFKKVKHASKRVIQVLTIIEFSLLSLSALGCIFSQFKIINITGACAIFGLALWARGSVEIFRAYYYRADSKEHYPVWYLALSIAMITFGTYCFAKPFISDLVILWLFVSGIIVLGLSLLILGLNNKVSKKLISKK